MISITALRTFVHVAECGTIRDAAARLFRTPSAVSMTLTQLERELGAPLFQSDRKNRLTALGEAILQVARELVRDHDRGVDRIGALAAGREGRLHLASVPSVAAELMPGLLAEFLRARPGVRIELLDADSRSVHAMVADGTAEIGVAGPPDAGSALSLRPLFRDPFRLVCRSGDPLAQHTGPLDWADLDAARLIGNDASDAIASDAYRALLGGSAVKARNVISLLALVRAGAGVTLLPRLATVSMRPDLVALPLADPGAERAVGVILRQDRSMSPVCRAFLSDLLAAGRSLDAG